MHLKLNRWFNHRAKLGRRTGRWRAVPEASREERDPTSHFEDALAAGRASAASTASCGHIHKAEIRDIGGILYCNDGDWVESLTALVELESGELRIIDWKAIEALRHGALANERGQLAYSPGD